MIWRRQSNGKWTRWHRYLAGPITYTDHILRHNLETVIFNNLLSDSPLLCRIGKQIPVFHGGSVL